jgi:hypothetical protein
MSREKFCAKRLHKVNSAPDFSIPFLALDPFGVAAFVVAEARGTLSAPGQAPFFFASSLLFLNRLVPLRTLVQKISVPDLFKRISGLLPPGASGRTTGPLCCGPCREKEETGPTDFILTLISCPEIILSPTQQGGPSLAKKGLRQL